MGKMISTMTTEEAFIGVDTVDGWNPAPVEVGNLS